MLYFFPCEVLAVVGLALVNGAGYSEVLLPHNSCVGFGDNLHFTRFFNRTLFRLFIENSDVYATTKETVHNLLMRRFISEKQY